jgi:hypothetical protein
MKLLLVSVLAMMFLLGVNAMSLAEEKSNGGIGSETTGTYAERKSEPKDEPKAEMKIEEKDDTKEEKEIEKD